MEKLFVPGDILLPKNADMTLWSVIACDQYTSQPEYWDGVDERVGDAPSTLRLMLPEAYLELRDCERETERINRAMKSYLENGVFRELKDSFVYVERDMTVGERRCGIVGLIDLEYYDYGSDSVSPIHATEGTVESRLPPRVKVRQSASLELPHIVVFVDDPENRVTRAVNKGEKLYDFDLMDGGGHIAGWQISGVDAEKVEQAVESLGDSEYLTKRYGQESASPVIIAMGDGNHSLATAKQCWETIKPTLTPEQRKNHPARYGLAEMVNIHDPSVSFEPIHRVLFDTDADGFFSEAEKYFAAISRPGESHELRLSAGGRTRTLSVTGQTIGSLIALAQSFCSGYISERGGRLDYIHDDDTALELSSGTGCAGLLLPPMDKNELFPSIMETGVFPAKSFSIGPARDKRYYLECRRIK